MDCLPWHTDCNTKYHKRYHQRTQFDQGSRGTVGKDTMIRVKHREQGRAGAQAAGAPAAMVVLQAEVLQGRVLKAVVLQAGVLQAEVEAQHCATYKPI